jgi:hypothetical protein
MGKECGMNGEKRNAYSLLVEKPKGKRPLGRQRCKWVILLRWILERYDCMVQTGSVWLKIGTSGGLS